MSPQDFVMVIVGIIAAFMGYSLFSSMLPLWGFILGGWIAYTLFPSFMPEQAGNLVFVGAAFFGGGVIGAVVAKPLYYVIVFLSGAALGGVLGIILGALIDLGGISSFSQLDRLTALTFPPIPHTMTQFLFMIIFGILMGGMAINFQQFMITASSSFVGAAAIISGISMPLTASLRSPAGQGAVLLTAWIVLGFVAIFVQFRLLGET